MNTIYTFGYQGSTVEQLEAYQREHDALVVDIRYSPRSRHPQWMKAALVEELGENYYWIQALGNVNYWSGGEIQLYQPEAGRRWIGRQLLHRNVILVCQCPDVETCHRKVAAEYLSRELGAPINHLPARAESSPAENILKCLSLTQPWATLTMIGAKKIETRSWKTSYRGLLGIHAAKTFPKVARETCTREPFNRTLIAAGFRSVADLPFGALLGTVQLVDCVPVEYVRPTISSNEYAFGDYSDGRWAWKLEDPRPFKEPIVMKGALGLWNADLSLLQEVHP